MAENTWCYSFNEENFHGEFDSKQDAISEALELYKQEGEEGDFIWIGRCVPVTLTVDSDSVLEELSERAGYQVGEIACGYLDDVKKEHMNVLDERLTSIVKDWMKEFQYEPHFWGVADVERISVF